VKHNIPHTSLRVRGLKNSARGDSSTGSELKAVEEACREASRTVEPCGLSGHEKKFKNQENRKICLNEIEYLQLLIFAKRDFFSRPASLW
jgi:hypothetical protein